MPRTKFQRENLNVSPDAPALLIMDVFCGQMTTEVMDLPLDPFADVDPFQTSLDNMLTVKSFPKPGHADVNERNIDFDSEFEYEDEESDEEANETEERNAFDFIINKC